MSNNITTSSLQEQEKMNKKSLHRDQWNDDSGELDVFEAARYFSGANEMLGGNPAQIKSSMRKDNHDQARVQGGRRMSLDIPFSMRNSIPSSQSCHAAVLEKPTKEKKYYKQPSSPGGKLASFLNSLFNQTISSKKKKSKSTSTQSMKDEDESPGGRRKRRSSISHFRSATSNISLDTKSMYSTSSTTTTTTTSGFRTPPPYGYMIPTKTCKGLRSYSDHKPILTNINVSKTIVEQVKEVGDYSWLDEKFKFRDIGFLEKHKTNPGNDNGFLEKGRIWGDHKYQTEEKENFKRFSEEDHEGGDSDSSSDLFELSNCDLGYYSSGLPVYETTHMDSIKRGAPISTGGPN